MDRAHRLGQKKVVTVYRLLMRGTLEERIMSLQQFKKDVANAVVNADNVATDTMDTSGVVDLMAGAATSSTQRETKQAPGTANEGPVSQDEQPDEDATCQAFLSKLQRESV